MRAPLCLPLTNVRITEECQTFRSKTSSPRGYFCHGKKRLGVRRIASGKRHIVLVVRRNVQGVWRDVFVCGKMVSRRLAAAKKMTFGELEVR